MSGYRQDEIERINFLDLVSQENRELAVKWYVRRLENKKTRSNVRFKIISKSGEEIWIGINTVRINWVGSPALLCFAWDVTQEMKLSASLERAHKIEAIGTLASGVAHDLNNVLSGIVSYPDLLLMQIPRTVPCDHPSRLFRNRARRLRPL
jgi:PAS domain S-box-containing protein